MWIYGVRPTCHLEGELLGLDENSDPRTPNSSRTLETHVTMTRVKHDEVGRGGAYAKYLVYSESYWALVRRLVGAGWCCCRPAAQVDH